MPQQSSLSFQRADAIYDDPALIALYDILNAANHDHDFYRGEVPAGTRQIIDLGCGTGRFAIHLAQLGYAVTALDPAAGMIDFAKGQDTNGKVTWLVGTAVDLPRQPKADIVFMTGHAFQCLLTDTAIKETFDSVRTVLNPGGRFLFESRNPAQRPWSNWNTRQELTPAVLPHALTIERKVLEVTGELVSFEERYFLPGKILASTSTLRFPNKDLIVSGLRKAGFEEIDVFGDWDRNKFSKNSPEMIFSAG